MKKLIIVLVSLFIAVSCIRPIKVQNAQMQFHHRGTEKNSYWMSFNALNSNGQVETSLWYCYVDTNNKPICSQASLKICDPKTEDCSFVANSTQILPEMQSSVDNSADKQ